MGFARAVYLEGQERGRDVLNKRLKELGIDFDYRPGQHNNLLCPSVNAFLVYLESPCSYVIEKLLTIMLI